MSFDFTGPTLRLDLSIIHLTPGEAVGLIQWCGAKAPKFPRFCEYLATVLTDEMSRRLNEGHEPGNIPLPTLNNADAADFLQGVFVLAKMPLTHSQAAFADDLQMKVVCDIAGALEHNRITVEGTP